MRHFVVALVFAFQLVQAKPNFTGTWTRESSSDPGRNSQPFVTIIVQTDSTITAKNETGVEMMVLQLDGSETTMKIPGPGPGQPPREMRLRARWEGSRLLVEQHTQTVSMFQTMSLSEDGNKVTVETLWQRAGQAEERVVEVFKKSK